MSNQSRQRAQMDAATAEARNWCTVLAAVTVTDTITNSSTAAQTINADSWGQQISTGGGNDLIMAGQWELPAGATDADIISSGAGSDMVFTGQGADIIDAGDGDDFIMSGGFAGVLSLQSDNPASQAPAGAAWVHAGMGNWGLYNDSDNGDLGGRLQTLGLTTAQFWGERAGALAGDDPEKRAAYDRQIATLQIATNDHSTLGTGRFDGENEKSTACHPRSWVRLESSSLHSCLEAANGVDKRSISCAC